MLYIFDKDGTICRSKSGKGFINSIEDQELIPGVRDRIDELKNGMNKIAIASNQGGVAFGYMGLAQAWQIVRQAAQMIGADDYMLCPNHPQGTVDMFRSDSYFRKPNPGMIYILAIRLIGYINTDDIVFIGDRAEDREAAENAGIKFIWANDFFKRRQATSKDKQ